MFSEISDANFKAFMRSSEVSGEFDDSLSSEQFAQKYFAPYLPVKQTCVENQSLCWNNVKYKDLKNNSYDDGIGVGSACLALIKQNNWTIDKRYLW